MGKNRIYENMRYAKQPGGCFFDEKRENLIAGFGENVGRRRTRGQNLTIWKVLGASVSDKMMKFAQDGAEMKFELHLQLKNVKLQMGKKKS